MLRLLIRLIQIFLNENPDIRYIGSSFNCRTRNRWSVHKTDYKANRSDYSIYKYFDEYGIDNFTFKILKYYKCVDKKHLCMYEQLYMNKLKNINQKSAFCIHKKISKKAADKKYYYKNQMEISIKKKEYYNNKKLDLNKI